MAMRGGGGGWAEIFPTTRAVKDVGVGGRGLAWRGVDSCLLQEP